MAYITPEEFKARADIQHTTDDSFIESCVAAASEAIEDHCHRVFTAATTATARVFYRSDGPVLLSVDDISTTTGLIIKTDEDGDGTYETTWATTDYQLEPLNGLVNGRAHPYTRVRARDRYRWPSVSYSTVAPIEITAKWGWPAVPEKVVHACYELTHDLYSMKDVKFGASIGQLTEFGPLRVTRAVGLHAERLLQSLVIPVTG